MLAERSKRLNQTAHKIRVLLHRKNTEKSGPAKCERKLKAKIGSLERLNGIMDALDIFLFAHNEFS